MLQTTSASSPARVIQAGKVVVAMSLVQALGYCSQSCTGKPLRVLYISCASQAIWIFQVVCARLRTAPAHPAPFSIRSCCQ